MTACSPAPTLHHLASLFLFMQRAFLLFSHSAESYSLRPMDCSPPGSSVHEISQARILERVAVSFSRKSSRPRDQTCLFCISGRFIYLFLPLSHLVNPDLHVCLPLIDCKVREDRGRDSVCGFVAVSLVPGTMPGM